MANTNGGAIVYEVDPEALLKAADECQDVSDTFGEIVSFCERRPVPPNGAPPVVLVLLTAIGYIAQKFILKGREGQEKFAEMSEKMAEAARRYQEADQASADAYGRVPENEEDVFQGDDAGGEGGSGGSPGAGDTGAGGDGSTEDAGSGEDTPFVGPVQEESTEPGAPTAAPDAELEQLRADNEQLTTDNEQLAADNQQLTADNEQLTTDNEQLAADNQQLSTENQALTDENTWLNDQASLYARRDGYVAQIPGLRASAQQIDAGTEGWEDRIDSHGIENAYSAYLVDRELPPRPSLDDQMQALEARIETYYTRLDTLDGIDPLTTDPAQVDALGALVDEGAAIDAEYQRIQQEVLYAEQYKSARAFFDDGAIRYYGD